MCLGAALAGLLALGSVPLAASAVGAAGVDPSKVTATLPEGGSTTINKTVHTPAIPPKPDVLILADTTGSMGPTLTSLKGSLNTLVTDVRAAQPDAQFGVADYRDFDNCPDDTYAYKLDQAITGSLPAVQSAVNGYATGNGCDTPEQQLNALFQIASDTPPVGWRSGSTRVVAWFGDATGHDPSFGHTLNAVITALKAAKIRVVAVPIDTGADGLDGTGQATAITAGTGGTLVTSTDPSDIGSAILAGLQNLPVTVAPVADPTCDPHLAVSWTPASKTVTSGDDATFVEKIAVSSTATPGSTLTCVVDFLLNGQHNTDFDEAITIRVPRHGTLEICKSEKNGMSGRPFQFAIDGGSPITVVGGGCSNPLSVTPVAHTIVEVPTPGLRVKAIKAKHVVSKNVATGTVTVTVVEGSTEANETLVTYTNVANAAIGLKICKAAGVSSPSLVGDQFSFTENGGPAFSVAAGTPAAPKCGPVQKFKLGTLVDIAELPTTGTHVSGITVSDGRGSNVNTAAGTVTATVGAGVTVVTYTNDLDPIVETGYVEVCKSALDQFVEGTFDFTIADSKGTVSHQSTLVGQCTAPIPVAVGNVTVTEAAQALYYVGEIDVFPSGRSVSSNLTNRTVTVKVPFGDTSTETVVNFGNATHLAYFKVCKTLTANSSALAGKSFGFDVADAASEHIDWVTAGPPGSTACIIDRDAVPVGSHVTITELLTDNVQNVSVGVSPAGNDGGSAAPTARLIIGSGITTATFTNQALGTIEVCKTGADPSTLTRTFMFSVNGGLPFPVHAGQCSMPIAVPAGTATVAEAGLANFHLVSVSAKGPALDNRVVSGTNPVTVSVPFGGVENETNVNFTNAVNTGQFKICKASVEPTLQGVTFQFTYSYTVNGAAVTKTTSAVVGGCSGMSGNIPVVDPTGAPIPILITEAATPTVAVSNIAVANGTLAASNPGNGTATVYVKQGVTQVTYTNVRTGLD